MAEFAHFPHTFLEGEDPELEALFERLDGLTPEEAEKEAAALLVADYGEHKPVAFYPQDHIGGAYYHPQAPNNPLVLTARHRFLRTIQIMPEAHGLVMDPLRGMLPLYSDRDRRDELKQQIRAWAEQRNLCRNGKGEWILGEADDTLWLWSAYPKMQCWGCLQYEMWEPGQGPRRRKGMKRFPAGRYKRLDHYEWLVMHQVLRAPLPPEDVGRRGRLRLRNSRLPGKREKLKAVFRGLRRIIDLPELPRGRPAKKDGHRKRAVQTF